MKVPAYAPITQAGCGTNTQYHYEERRTGCLRRLEPDTGLEPAEPDAYKATALPLS